MKIPGARDSFLSAITNGDSKIVYGQDRLFSHIVLAFPMRDYFIKLKKHLQKAIIKLADQHIILRQQGYGIDDTPLVKAAGAIIKILPEPKRNNSDSINAFAMERVFNKFLTYAIFKPSLFNSAFKLIKFELGHDKAYDDSFQLILEEIILEILRGNWKVREEHPYSGFWSNNTPRGGRHSIISILQDKKAMENLLGDKWKLED